MHYQKNIHHCLRILFLSCPCSSMLIWSSSYFGLTSLNFIANCVLVRRKYVRTYESKQCVCNSWQDQPVLVHSLSLLVWLNNHAVTGWRANSLYIACLLGRGKTSCSVCIWRFLEDQHLIPFSSYVQMVFASFWMACVEDLRLTWRYIASLDQGVKFDCVHVL